jgi:hypothetical protein
MKKVFIFLQFAAIVSVASAQKKQSVNLFVSGYASNMIYDEFSGFTFTGLGAGIQLHLNAAHKLKPQIDVAGNLFPINKIAFILPDGSISGPKQSVATIFAGFVYEPLNRLETGLSTGPAFHDDGTDIGIKPHLAYYLGKKKIIKAHASFTHIFVHNQFSNYNTGIINAGLAVKLF